MPHIVPEQRSHRAFFFLAGHEFPAAVIYVVVSTSLAHVVGAAVFRLINDRDCLVTAGHVEGIRVDGCFLTLIIAISN